MQNVRFLLVLHQQQIYTATMPVLTLSIFQKSRKCKNLRFFYEDHPKINVFCQWEGMCFSLLVNQFKCDNLVKNHFMQHSHSVSHTLTVSHNVLHMP